MAENNFRSDRGRDPIAELAGLIGQADPHGENAAANDGFREAGASHGCDELPQLPPAHQLPGYPNAPEQAYEPREHRHDDKAYQHADDEPYSADNHYEDEAPRAGRRSSVVLVMALFGLAVVGTAGAFGYRATFGGSILPTLPPIVKASNEPSIALTSSKSQANNSANASQAGAATTASAGKLVSREEQQVTIEPPKPASPVISPIPIAKGQGSPPDMSTPVGGQAAPNQTTPGGVAAAANSQWPHPPAMAAPSTAPAAAAPAPAPQVSSEPRKIHTVTIRADQSGVADVSAESTRAHVATAATALANANSAAAVAFSGSGGGYAVQVTSARSESKAQAAFRALQAKYPNQLSGRQPIIRRADLGAKGTYYRALVGPFASAEKAAGLCSGLKAAGGNCIVQRN
jgi:SPOR domain